MTDQLITDHYGQSELLISFERAIGEIGKTPETVTAAELAPADEFHIGGRPATEHLFDQLQFPESGHVLDLGCGIGGPARQAAKRCARVTGVDLTPEYVETGSAINTWLELGDQIELLVGSALALDFPDGSFDGGYMIHVGMNIEKKPKLLAEVARVLAPGATFGIYDVMRFGDGQLEFPVPWATDPSTSHVARPADYREAAAGAGLLVIAENNRAEAAKAAFAQLAKQAGPSPLGLHLVMGATVGEKVRNMVANVEAGLIAPVELVLSRPE